MVAKFFTSPLAVLAVKDEGCLIFATNSFASFRNSITISFLLKHISSCLGHFIGITFFIFKIDYEFKSFLYQLLNLNIIFC